MRLLGVKRAKRGFTLIEVMVALLIVAIAIGAGLRVSGSQVNFAQRAVNNLGASLCANNQLVAMRLARQLPDVGTGSKTCIQGAQTLTVLTQVQPTPNPSFRRVDVSVHPSDQDAQSRSNTQARLVTVLGRF